MPRPGIGGIGQFKLNLYSPNFTSFISEFFSELKDFKYRHNFNFMGGMGGGEIDVLSRASINSLPCTF